MKTTSKRILLAFLLMLLCAINAEAQLSVYSSQATHNQNVSNGIVVLAPIPNAQVRVCTTPASGSPCTPIAAIFDINGSPVGVDPGNFGQITTSATGAFSFQCTSGVYEIQIAPSTSNTPAIQYLAACPLVTGSSGSTGTGLTVLQDSPLINSPTLSNAILNTPIINSATFFPPLASGVSSVFGRTGAVVAVNNDYDFSNLSGSASCLQMPALSGDITSTAGSCSTLLPTVNSNVGSFTTANITVNAKGQVTAAASGSAGIPSQQVAPNQNAIYLSPNCGTQTNCYPIKATGAYDCGTSWANTSHNITLSAQASRQFTQADVGTIAWGANYQCGAAVTTSITLQLAQTTIATVTDGTHATVTAAFSNTCNVSGEGNCTFVWGDTDETTAVNTWFTALTASCGNTGVLPSGIIFVSLPINASGLCTLSNYVATTMSHFGVRGQGVGSSIIAPVPTFNATSCVSSKGAIFADTSTPGNQGVQLSQFSVNGFGDVPQSVQGSGCAAIQVAANSSLDHVAIFNWGVGTSNFIGLSVGGIQDGSPTTTYAVTVLNVAGATECTVGGWTVNYFLECEGTSGSSNASLGTGNIITHGSTIGFNGAGVSGVVFSTTGTNWYSSNDYFTKPRASQQMLTITASNTVHLFEDDFETGASTGTQLINNKGTLYLRDTKVNGSAATSTAINLSASTGILYDLGGNTITGTTAPLAFTAGAQIIADGHSVNGACTGVATASQTLGLYGTGPNETTTTCTSTTIGSGQVMQRAGTLQFLVGTASAAGTAAGSGVLTVLKNGSGTALTCTYGTTTACSDGTHTVAVVAGDLISFNFTTQGSETLADVKAFVDLQ